MPGNDRELHVLAEEYWQFRVREFPEEATLAGEPSFNDRFSDVAIVDCERRATLCAAMLERARVIEAGALDHEDALTLSLLIGQLENVIEAWSMGDHLTLQVFPVSFVEVPPYLVASTPLLTRKDHEDFIARLCDVPRYLEANLERLAIGVSRGYRAPRVVAARMHGLTEAELSPGGLSEAVQARFAKCPPGIDADAFEALRGTASLALEQKVLPAYRRIAAFYASSDGDQYRDTISICDQPNGREYYRFKVRQHTTTNLEPDEIHERGLHEMVAIRTQLATLIANAGFEADMDGFRAHHDTDVIEASAESLRARVCALAKTIDGLIPQLFGRLPRVTYGVKSFSAEQSVHRSAAMAQAAPADRSLAGTFWLTGLPERCPNHQLTALTLHEAWPGHLMQFALAHELDHLPTFRRRTWLDYNAYVEGWGLYCERLGHDFGLYDDPSDHYGQLSFDLWRASRLVVDTGIHWKHWSRDQAIAYMAENTLLPRAAILAEVDRYIAMPAQALSYKIGEMAIRQLRARASVQLGEDFSLRDFHDALLATGAVSLSVLEQHMQRWISGVRIQ